MITPGALRFSTATASGKLPAAIRGPVGGGLVAARTSTTGASVAACPLRAGPPDVADQATRTSERIDNRMAAEGHRRGLNTGGGRNLGSAMVALVTPTPTGEDASTPVGCRSDS